VCEYQTNNSHPTARNGMQGPVYPIPAPSYSGGSHGPQQPLFIIIPSGGGKPSYRSAQHTPIYSAPPTSYGEDYGQHHSHEAARSSRRISLARRLGGRMCRRRRQRKALGPPGPPVDSHSMNDPMSLRLGLSKQIRPLSKAQSNKVQIHDRQGYNVSTRYQC